MTIMIKTRSDGIKQKYHLSPLRPKVKKFYAKGLSSRDVGKKLGISHTRVLKILKTEGIERRDVTKKIPNKNYKQLTPERAYILGVMCGDGCIFSGLAQKRDWKYKLYIVHLSVKDKDFIDEFVRCIKEVYGIPPSIYYRKRRKRNPRLSNIWIARITRKKVYNDLASYGFRSKDWKVPKEIINSSDEKIVSSFLRGFYDSEGSVSIGKRSFCIFVHSINSSGLQDIKKLLQKMGIHSSKLMIDNKPSRKLFYFVIYRKKDIKTFLNKVCFSIQRKQKKLKDI